MHVSNVLLRRRLRRQSRKIQVRRHEQSADRRRRPVQHVERYGAPQGAQHDVVRLQSRFRQTCERSGRDEPSAARRQREDEHGRDDFGF